MVQQGLDPVTGMFVRGDGVIGQVNTSCCKALVWIALCTE